MFLSLLSIEARKLFKHPWLWLGLAGLIGFFGLYFAARYAMMSTAVRNGLVDTRGLELDLQIGIGLFSFLSILFYGATTALVSAYDFSDRGVQMWLVRGVPRPLLMLARLLVILAFGFILVMVAAAISLGFGALMRSIFLGNYSAHNLNWTEIFPAILRVFWDVTPYLTLTVLLASMSRSPLFAAGGILVFRTVLENLLFRLADRFPYLTRLLPSQLAFVLEFYTYSIDRTTKAMHLGDTFLTEPQAVLAIGILLLLFGGLSIIIFSRQDWGG
jgi:hypothetical protein